MTDHPEDTGPRTEDGPDSDQTAPDQAGPDKDAAANGSPAGGLSSKLDPDFIPQQGDTPEAARAREHPEETGS